MVQVALLGVRADRVHALDVARRAERGDRERLRLATGEDRRPVSSRQDADLDADRPDGRGVAAIDANVLAQHQLTNGRLGDDVHQG